MSNMLNYFIYNHEKLDDGKDCIVVWSDDIISYSKYINIMDNICIKDNIRRIIREDYYIVFNIDAATNYPFISGGLRLNSEMKDMIDRKLNKEKSDAINPAHYKLRNGLEVIDILEDIEIAKDYCQGNAIKYLIRAGRKDSVDELEDFKKAQWYVNKLVSLLEIK